MKIILTVESHIPAMLVRRLNIVRRPRTIWFVDFAWRAVNHSRQLRAFCGFRVVRGCLSMRVSQPRNTRNARKEA